MAQMSCECGARMSNVGECNPYEGYLFSNEDANANDRVDPLEGIEVWECTKCGNLSIQPDRHQNKFITYKPANSQYNSILVDKSV